MSAHQELSGLPLPLPKTEGQWMAFLSTLGTLNHRSGMTSMLKGGPGYFIGLAKNISGVTDGTPVLAVGDPAGHWMQWDGSELQVQGKIVATSGTLGSLSVIGDLSIGSGGDLRSGQTAFRTGTGFWMAYNGGTPQFSMGSGSSTGISWDGTTFKVHGGETVGSLAITTGGNLHSGQTAYNTGTGFWLEYNGGTPRMSVGSSSAGFTWDGTTFAVAGAITATSGLITGALQIGTGGKLYSGMSTYLSGTGFYMDYNAGTPRLAIGNSAGSYLSWDGSTLTVNGTIAGTSTISGKLGSTIQSETDNFLTPNSTITFTTSSGDIGTWRNFAKIPGNGSGATRGTFRVHVGFLSTPASPGWVFLVGVSTNGTCSAKLLYCNNDSTLYNNIRIRQDATSGDTYFQMLQAGSTIATVTVEIYPVAGTWDSNFGKPAAVANSASLGTANILGSKSIASLVEALFHSVGASIQDNQDGSHTRMGSLVFDTNAQLASQLRLMALNGPGYANAYWTGSGITAHPTSLNVASGTLHLGADTVSYGASSKTGLANSTTYSGYYQDSTLAGGSLSLNTTTSKQTLIASNANVYICEMTTQSGGGAGGGGSVGPCVGVQMYLAKRLKARLAHRGDWLDCADEFKLLGYRKINNVSTGCWPCVRIETDDGCALVCSTETPFTLEDGSTVYAPEMLGRKVLTDLGVATVTSVVDVGTQAVMRISCGGISYAAGERPDRRIYSHNVYKP